LRLTETFHSIQGEGTLIGIPMFFVRTNRCNLRCKWCDSTYTFEGGSEKEIPELVSEVREAKEDWICFTGGEPLLQRDAEEFVVKIVEAGKKVLIETSGSLPVNKFTSISGTVIDMDVKTPSSGEENSIHLPNLSLLRPSDYIKFVIQDDNDYQYAKNFLNSHKDEIKCEIVFQPAWGTDLKWLVESTLSDDLQVRVLTQMHKLIWGEISGV
jgi:7-carboxy-7-deazaguanine synthase